MYSYYQEETESEQGKWRTFLKWGVDLVAVIALAVFAVLMFGEKVTMSGRSMEPTFQSGDVVLLDKLWYNFSKPDRMDVVAFENTEEATKIYIKRIVGLPGERVQIQDGKVFINGKMTKIDGLAREIALPGLAEQEIELGEDEYFVLGDDPDTSEDSRFANVGNIREDQILGRLWFRISPFSNLGFVK